jgi:hypothetical protein
MWAANASSVKLSLIRRQSTSCTTRILSTGEERGPTGSWNHGRLRPGRRRGDWIGGWSNLVALFQFINAETD